MDKEQEFISLQNELAKKIEICPLDVSSIKFVAGVDIAYYNRDGIEWGACSIVVIDFVSRQVVEEVSFIDKVSVPYIPGCLAFRELPLFEKAKEKLTNKIDLYVFDGNGYLHPRHMGLATHAGVEHNIASIGVAKTYYKVNNVCYTPPQDKMFAYTDIVIDNEVYGRAVVTKSGVRPIFLSIGNKIDLDSAYNIIISLVGESSHIPLPTLIADACTRKLRRLSKS